MPGREGRAVVPIPSFRGAGQSAEPGDRRSLNPDAPAIARASGQPSTPAREGEEDKMRLPRFAYFVLGGLFGVLFGHSAVTHAQTTATIHGSLTDPSGASVQGASISAQPLDSSAAVVRERSGADGSFSMSLAPGRYHLSVEYPSFAREENEFTLTAGE